MYVFPLFLPESVFVLVLSTFVSCSDTTAPLAGHLPDNHTKVALINVLSRAHKFELALARTQEFNVIQDPSCKEAAKVRY